MPLPTVQIRSPFPPPQKAPKPVAKVIPFLKKVVKSKAFTHAATALLGFLASLLGGGCSVLSPARSPALDVFECRVRVLAPFVGDAAGAIVPQLSAGAVNPIQLLLGLGLTEKEILKLATDYQACAPVVEPEPAPEQKPVELLKT